MATPTSSSARPRRRRQAWIPDTERLSLNPDAGSRSAEYLRQSLLNLIEIMGTGSSAARLLDIDRAQITRWQHGDSISPEMARRIFDLNDVLQRALRQFSPSVVPHWLLGSEPHLGGARPIDVLALRGPAPVIAALSAIEDGAYA